MSHHYDFLDYNFHAYYFEISFPSFRLLLLAFFTLQMILPGALLTKDKQANKHPSIGIPLGIQSVLLTFIEYVLLSQREQMYPSYLAIFTSTLGIYTLQKYVTPHLTLSPPVHHLSLAWPRRGTLSSKFQTKDLTLSCSPRSKSGPPLTQKTEKNLHVVNEKPVWDGGGDVLTFLVFFSLMKEQQIHPLSICLFETIYISKLAFLVPGLSPFEYCFTFIAVLSLNKMINPIYTPTPMTPVRFFCFLAISQSFILLASCQI